MHRNSSLHAQQQFYLSASREAATKLTVMTYVRTIYYSSHEEATIPVVAESGKRQLEEENGRFIIIFVMLI